MKNAPLFVAWMIYGKRQNLWIINLKLTIYMLSLSVKLVNKLTNQKSPFWFVNQDKKFSQFLEWIGMYCGEVTVSGMWINGMITNYISVGLKYLLKKNLTNKLSWPRGVFISSVFFSKSALLECNKTKIVCIGIFDTNILASGAKIAIPGNDDSSDCILFYNMFYAKLVLKEKFFQIICWFTNILKLNSKFNLVINFKGNNESFFFKKLLECYFNLFKLTFGKVERVNIAYSFSLEEKFKSFRSLKSFFWINKIFFVVGFFVSRKRLLKLIKLRKVNKIFFFDLNIKKKILSFLRFFIMYKIIIKKNFKKRYLKWIKLFVIYDKLKRNVYNVY